MGFTPNLAVGTWSGNNNNASMGGGLSGLITAPTWREFMDYALAKIPDEKFAQPQIDLAGVKPIIRGDYIDSTMLLQQMAQSGTTTANIGNILNNIHSILYFVKKDDPQGPYPDNPNNEGQYYNWEYAVQKWKNEIYGGFLQNNSTTTPENVE